MGWSIQFRAGLNALSFATRRLIHWQRGIPQLRNEDKQALFSYLSGDERRSARARAKTLLKRYQLGPLYERSTQPDYRDNLYLLDALDSLLGELSLPPGRPVRALDVGAKNWCYVFGLERFLRLSGAAHGREVQLWGVEIDGFGIYPDFYSRADYAAAYVAQTGNDDVQFKVEDFLDTELPALDVVTLLFPFLSEEALVRWGLPLRMYAPEAIIAKSIDVLRPNGVLVVFNQTESERTRLGELLEPLAARIESTCSLQSKLVHYHELASERWATAVRRL